MIGLTYERRERVVGWHRHYLGGEDSYVISIAVIPEDEQDELWLAVVRMINGSPVTHIEYMTAPFDAERALVRDLTPGEEQNMASMALRRYAPVYADMDELQVKTHDVTDFPLPNVTALAFFADCGLTYTGEPVTTISGLGHLEGETVAILADGAVQKSQTVTGGQVTLEYAASVVHVGLPYLSFAKTLPLQLNLADGSSHHATRNIPKVWIHVHETASLNLAAVEDEGAFNILPFREPDWLMDSPTRIVSGLLEWNLESPHTKQAAFIFAQIEPLPGTILGVTTRQNMN